MLILNEENKVLDTDIINEECYYSVLSFKDYRQPDVYFQKLTEIEVFESASLEIEIGPFKTVVPYHWSIMVSDHEYVEMMPIADTSGRSILAFCINPIDGFLPQYYPIRINNIFPINPWSCPPIKEKDLILLPLGVVKKPNETKDKGPICVIMTPHKLDVTRPIGDIWGV